MLPATRGSKTTGRLWLLTLRGLSRRAARSAARRPSAGRLGQILGADHGRELVVPLHLAVGGGDHRGAQAVARARRAADKAVGRDERRAGPRPAGLGTLGIGDLGQGECGILGRGRELGQHLGSPAPRRRRDRARADRARSDPARRDRRSGPRAPRLRDRERVLDQPLQARRPEVAGRDDCLAPADEHPKAQIGALGALDFLQFAEPAGGALAGALDQHRIGGIGARLPGAGDQVVEKVEVAVGPGHRSPAIQGLQPVPQIWSRPCPSATP